MASYMYIIVLAVSAPLFIQAIVMPDHIGCFEDPEGKVLIDVSGKLSMDAYTTMFERKNKEASVNWNLVECSMECVSRRYMFTGIRNGVECYCGNDVEWNELITPDKCPIVCEHKYKLKCGGLNTTSIYRLNNMYLYQDVYVVM